MTKAKRRAVGYVTLFVLYFAITGLFPILYLPSAQALIAIAGIHATVLFIAIVVSILTWAFE